MHNITIMSAGVEISQKSHPHVSCPTLKANGVDSHKSMRCYAERGLLVCSGAVKYQVASTLAGCLLGEDAVGLNPRMSPGQKGW